MDHDLIRCSTPSPYSTTVFLFYVRCCMQNVDWGGGSSRKVLVYGSQRRTRKIPQRQCTVMAIIAPKAPRKRSHHDKINPHARLIEMTKEFSLKRPNLCINPLSANATHPVSFLGFPWKQPEVRTVDRCRIDWLQIIALSKPDSAL